jgi:hypothetical protein
VLSRVRWDGSLPASINGLSFRAQCYRVYTVSGTHHPVINTNRNINTNPYAYDDCYTRFKNLYTDRNSDNYNYNRVYLNANNDMNDPGIEAIPALS